MMNFRTTAPSVEKLTDVVWIQTAFLGDIILNVAVCRWLKLKFPKIRQHFVTTQVGVDALVGEDVFESLIAFEKRSGGFFQAVRKVKDRLRGEYALTNDTCVTLQAHRSYRSSLLTKWLGLPSVTYDDTKFAFLATKRVHRSLHLHETMRDAELLAAVNINPATFTSPKPWLIGQEPSAALHSIFPFDDFSSKFVGVATGSVWATKRWPKEGYAKVVENLLTRHADLKVVLLGGPSELDEARFIASQMPQALKPRLLELVGKTTLLDLRAIYPRLRLLLSNDSSPVQYASAFNVPTVAIFGPTVPQFGFGPLADHSIVVETSLECRPCSPHGPMVCPLGHFKCMRMIEHSTVLQACENLLAK